MGFLKKIAEWVAPVFLDWAYRKVSGLIKKFTDYQTYKKEQRAVDAASESVKNRVINAQTSGERDAAADDTFKNT